MAFNPRGRQLSIPKGEEPSSPVTVFSRSFSRHAQLLGRARCPQSQKREGSRPPSWVPSPGSCPPLACQALVPDRCFSIYAAETAGFKIAPVPASVRAPQGHSAEREDLLAGAGKEQEATTTHSPFARSAGARPSLPNLSRSLRKVCAPSRR